MAEKDEPETESQNTEIAEREPEVAAPMELEQLLKLIPEDQRPNASVIVSRMISRRYSGPIPHAEEMAKYRDIDPSFPERMLVMAEKQSEHRQALETEVVSSDFKLKGRGQNYALIALVLLALLAGGLIYIGAAKEAAAVASIAIVGVVGIFVTGRVVSSAEKDEEE